MLRFYYDWESPLVKMFWVELWPILLKEFGEELVLNEILSVCTLVARDSTVNSAQYLRTACTAQYKATYSVCTTSRRPPPGSQSNCCHFASNHWMKRNESSSGSIVNFEASFSILGALRFSLTKAKSLNLDNSATPLGNSCDYFLLDKLGR